MSVIIRLQNLPWAANSMDIRNYFQGLSIPEGGVHIVGGEQGDAFIAFSTDEDARQAMMNDGGKIKEVKIKLLLSSRSEMQKVIEQARQTSMNFQNMIQQNPVAAPAIPTPVAMTDQQQSRVLVEQQNNPVAQTTQKNASTTGNGVTPAQNQNPMSQQALAQKDWQGMAAMGMQQMPGMIPGMPMMGLMQGMPAHFAQMAQMGLLGHNPMAMAQFFSAQKPGMMPGAPGAAPTGADNTSNTLQNTPNVHPVFTQGPHGQFIPPGPGQMGAGSLMGMMGFMPGGPMPNQISPNSLPGGPNSMPGGLNAMPGGPNSMLGGPNSMPGGPNSMPGGPNSLPVDQNSMPGGPNSMLGGPNSMPGGQNSMHGGPNSLPGGPNSMPSGPNSMPGGPNSMPGGLNSMPGGQNSMHGGPNSMPGGPNSMPGGPNLMAGGPNSMPGDPNAMLGGPNPIFGVPMPNQMSSGPNSLPGGPMSNPPMPGGPSASGPNAMGAGLKQQPPAPPTITPADRTHRSRRRESDEDEVKILEENKTSRSSRSLSRERRRSEREARDRRKKSNRSRSRSRSRERRRRERSRERARDRRSRKSRSRSRDRSSRWNKNDSKHESSKAGSQQAGQKSDTSEGNQDSSRKDDSSKRNSQESNRSKQESNRSDSGQQSPPGNTQNPYNKSFTVLTPNLNLSLPKPSAHIPFSNIDTKLNIGNWKNKTADYGVKSPEPNTCLEMRNVPLSVRYTDIKAFFQYYPLWHVGIKIINDINGKRTGIVYVQFFKSEVRQKALQDLNGARLLDSQVELLPIDDEIFRKAQDSYRPNRNTMETTSPPKPQTPIVIFKVMQLPSNVQRKDLCEIFEGCELETIRVNRDDPTKIVAFVKIKDADDALRFTSVRKQHKLAGKQVLVLPCFEAEFAEAVKKFPDEPDPILTDCVLIKNLPRSASDRDVCDFFSDIGLVPLKIHLMFTAQGEPSGDVFCEFQSPEEANRAVSKNDSLFGRNTVSVLLVTRQTLNEALGTPLPGPNLPPSLLGPGPPGYNVRTPGMMGMPGPPPSGNSFNDPRQMMDTRGGPLLGDPRMDRQRGPPMGPNGMELGDHGLPMDGLDGPLFDNRYSPRGGMRGRGRGRGGYVERGDRYNMDRHLGDGPGEDHNGRREEFHTVETDVTPENFGKPGCVLALENIPYRANMDDILRFFRGFELTRENIIRRYDEDGRATGDARVCLVSHAEAQRALHTLHQQPMYGRAVFLSPV